MGLEFGGALDAYLEAPYVQAAAQQEAMEAWCEANDVDPDADDAWAQFEQWCDDEAEAHEMEIAEAQRETQWDEY